MKPLDWLSGFETACRAGGQVGNDQGWVIIVLMGFMESVSIIIWMALFYQDIIRSQIGNDKLRWERTTW